MTLTVYSLASYGPQQRTATITFSDTPFRLYSTVADDARGKTIEWRLNIVHPLSTQTDTVCINTHFMGFTPVSPLENDEEHLIEYVAVYRFRTLADLWSQLYCYTWLGKSCTWTIQSPWGYLCVSNISSQVGLHGSWACFNSKVDHQSHVCSLYPYAYYLLLGDCELRGDQDVVLTSLIAFQGYLHHGCRRKSWLPASESCGLRTLPLELLVSWRFRYRDCFSWCD